MPEPKKHHYVPRCLLKRFADREGFTYHGFRVDGRTKVIRQKAENVFYEKHLYSEVTPEGIKRADLEKHYAALESDVSPILDALVDNAMASSLADLTAGQHQTIREFIYHQWRRVPEFYHHIWAFDDERQKRQHLLNLLHARGVEVPHDEILDKLPKSDLDRYYNNGRIGSLWECKSESFDVIMRMKLAVVVVKGNASAFVIGSFPVLKFAEDVEYNLLHEDTQIVLPIASEVALMLNHRDSALALIDQRVVRYINLASAKRSRAIVGRSEPQVKSLLRPK